MTTESRVMDKEVSDEGAGLSQPFSFTKKTDEDPFDSVICAEDISWQKGYLEGLQEGRKESSSKGFVVGYNTASSVSWDLGYARSFCATLLTRRGEKQSTLTPFGRKLCEEIIRKVATFPHTNVETEDLVAKVNDVRSALDKVRSVVLKKPSVDENLGQRYSL